jgi:aldehyde dehydrogenase
VRIRGLSRLSGLTWWACALRRQELETASTWCAADTLQPAEAVCLSVLEFVKEMADIIPPGVVNLIRGYGEDVAQALVAHPEVRKVAFTDSTPTARKVIQYASVNISVGALSYATCRYVRPRPRA